MKEKDVIAQIAHDITKIDRAINKAVDAVILNGDNFMVIDMGKVKYRNFAIQYIIARHHLNVIKEGNSLLVLDIDDEIKKRQAILKRLYKQALDTVNVAMSEDKKETKIEFAKNDDYLHKLGTLLAKAGFVVTFSGSTINISWA